MPYNPEYHKEWLSRNREHRRQYMSDRLYTIKMAALDIAGTRACIRCGFEHPAALHFHHRDPATKRFGVNTANLSRKTYSMEEIVEEIAKCDVVCANCHAIEHCTWDQ